MGAARRGMAGMQKASTHLDTGPRPSYETG
jgi:hypothetical protein